jgi:hypothetical protein
MPEYEQRTLQLLSETAQHQKVQLHFLSSIDQLLRDLIDEVQRLGEKPAQDLPPSLSASPAPRQGVFIAAKGADRR